jgi:hypothetical protein
MCYYQFPVLRLRCHSLLVRLVPKIMRTSQFSRCLCRHASLPPFSTCTRSISHRILVGFIDISAVTKSLVKGGPIEF